MPRNEEIGTAIFCVICLVIFIIYSHREGKKQLEDREITMRKKAELPEASLSLEANIELT